MDTCKTRACISRSHSQVRQIQPTNLSTPKHLSYRKEMYGRRYEGEGTAPVFTVDIHDDGAELLPARLRTQPWRGASWPPLTRTIRTQRLVAALLSSSAPATRIYSRVINILASVCPDTPEC